MSRNSKDHREQGASQAKALDWSGVCCGASPWLKDEDEDVRPYCVTASGDFDPDRLARAYALNGAKSEEFPDGTKWHPSAYSRWPMITLSMRSK